MKQAYRKLYTSAGERLNNSPSLVPWDEYPRPHMRRAEWLNLNGFWDFETESGYSGRIRVPFCPESLLSGFGGELTYGEKLRYKRTFSVPEAWNGRRVILNLGAVSRASSVLVNGKKAVESDSAYFPICADITELLSDGENTLEIICVNDLDPAYPYGKQKLNRGGMWYTPCSGVWQTVWLEPVPEEHIKEIVCETDGESATVTVEGPKSGELICEGKSRPIVNGKCRIVPEKKRLWSPEEPNLYEFTVRCGEDEAESYFALRTVGVGEADGVKRILLNGKPYFFNGLLDQGYFSDGLWTPAEPSEYARDIGRMKALGFNMLRKHIKIEPELFYYYCDRLGVAVFQDMVNNGKYCFFRDTLLPTAGVKRFPDGLINRNRTARSNFLKAMERTVALLKSHPSIVYWTVFNEGWGQFKADAAYEAIKALDGSRVIDTTSGWFHRKKTDVISLHIYFKKLRLGRRRDKPQVISEFGGYVWKLGEHSFNREKTYGYKILNSREEYASALGKLYREELAPLIAEGLSAAVYTQVSDVEDETNGLLTFDRRVIKASSDMFLIEE